MASRKQTGQVTNKLHTARAVVQQVCFEQKVDSQFAGTTLALPKVNIKWEPLKVRRIHVEPHKCKHYLFSPILHTVQPRKCYAKQCKVIVPMLECRVGKWNFALQFNVEWITLKIVIICLPCYVVQFYRQVVMVVYFAKYQSVWKQIMQNGRWKGKGTR